MITKDLPLFFWRVPVVKERLFNAGSEVVGSSPAQATATIKSETERNTQADQRCRLA
jgi:hypothetical protein